MRQPDVRRPRRACAVRPRPRHADGRRNAAPHSGAVQGRPAAEPAPRHLENALPHVRGAVRRRMCASSSGRAISGRPRSKPTSRRTKRTSPISAGPRSAITGCMCSRPTPTAGFSDRENISIAPDTHVLQASARLGVLTEDELHGGSAQTLAARRWDALLEGTGLLPTDLHTRSGCGAAAGFRPT